MKHECTIVWRDDDIGRETYSAQSAAHIPDGPEVKNL